MRDILVFGRDGQLASELLPQLAQRPTYRVRSFQRPEVDLTQPAAVRELVLAQRPWLVINAAAYTAVDRAESEPETVFSVNAEAPGAMAQACNEVGAPLIHISTDYVFDGAASRAYVESDPIGPINVYGKSKAEGEARVRAMSDQHIILRTSWVFARHGHNFVRTMLRAALAGRELAVVDDQIGTPTDALQLAKLVATITDRLAEGTAGPFGTFHATGGEPVTWFRFAEAIFAAAARQGLPEPNLRPTTTKDYPTPAARPRFSLLDCTALARDWGLSVTPWTVALDDTVGFVLRDLRGNNS